jgi:uncharacterized damage-inducible protein DinB
LSEIEWIEDQLQRAFEGNAWHGPSVHEVLADVTPEQAAARPIPAAHSIWEIVLHMRFWEAAVEARARGSKLEVTPERDWPRVTDSSVEAWRASLQALERGHRRLRATIGRLDAAALPEQIGPRTTLYGLLHGIVQHDLYHAGQIAVLKKAKVKRAKVKKAGKKKANVKKAGKRRRP